MRFYLKTKIYPIKAENVDDLRQTFLNLLATDDIEAAATYEHIDITELRQTVKKYKKLFDKYDHKNFSV